jgi:glycosyltransferase involved in cell wall biosynthesis
MISVILATHNGSDTIARTLEALSLLQAPKGGWELLVVNNASTDDTEAQVLAWQDRLPLTYRIEPRLGKSHALNAGLKLARGDLIVMTDDDVLPDPDWLIQWDSTAGNFPQCSFFGGAVVPEFGAMRPPSVLPAGEYGILYGATHDAPEGPLAPSWKTGLYNAAGANIAIRRSVRDEGHRFDTELSVGSGGIMGEDTEFINRLARAGHRMGFSPKARLRHIIQPHQLTWSWIYRRFVRGGRCDFMLLDVRQDNAGRLQFRFPHHRIPSALGSLARLVPAALRRNEQQLFRQAHGLACDLGALQQAVWLCFSRKPRPSREAAS